MKGETTDEIINFIRKQIDQVMNSYQWLCTKTRKENENSTDQRLLQHLSHFKKIFKKTANANDSVYALEGLAELLVQHFGKQRMMILIDDGDIPVTYAISKKIDVKPIYDFMHFLLKKFVQYDRVACHVMIVGTSYVPFLDWITRDDPLWTRIIQHNQFLFSPVKFRPYFGFTIAEVDTLMNSNSIEQYEREEAKKYFNHYTFFDEKSTNESLYHPTAILRYLETNIIEDDHLSVPILLPPAMKCLQMQEFFLWIFKFHLRQKVTNYL